MIYVSTVVKRRKYRRDLLRIVDSFALQPKIGILERRRVVVVHVHYEETWVDLRKSIANIRPDLILITTTRGLEFKTKVLNDFPAAVVTLVPNQGRDIFPLVKLAQEGHFKEPSVVFKLHSKRSLHLLNGDQWRRDLLFSLAGTPQIADSVSYVLSQSRFSLVGDDRYLREMTLTRVQNNPIFQDWSLTNQINLDLAGVRYIDGTIFACRSEVVDELSRLGLTAEDFTMEADVLKPFSTWFAIKMIASRKLSRFHFFRARSQTADLQTRPATPETYAMESFFGFLAKRHGLAAGVLESLNLRFPKKH